MFLTTSIAIFVAILIKIIALFRNNSNYNKTDTGTVKCMKNNIKYIFVNHIKPSVSSCRGSNNNNEKRINCYRR